MLHEAKMISFVALWMVGILLVIYPLCVGFGHSLGHPANEDKDRERVRLAKLGLLECYLVDMTNEFRRAQGLPPVEYRPMMDRVDGQGWTVLRDKIRQVALAAATKLAWVKEVPS